MRNHCRLSMRSEETDISTRRASDHLCLCCIKLMSTGSHPHRHVADHVATDNSFQLHLDVSPCLVDSCTLITWVPPPLNVQAWRLLFLGCLICKFAPRTESFGGCENADRGKEFGPLVNYLPCRRTVHITPTLCSSFTSISLSETSNIQYVSIQ